MDTTDITDYYASLLILQYQAKTKASATIKGVTTPIVMDQLPTQIQNAFNLDIALGPVAVGKQLDILGKYMGGVRVGFNFSGATTLNDADFLTYLHILIARNSLASDQASIQAFLQAYFPGVVQEFDHLSMRLSYMYLAAIGVNPVAEFFIKAGQLPKPLGVQLSTLTYNPTLLNFFGFRTYAHAGVNVSPFNTYASTVTAPWLSYTNGIQI